MEDSQLTKRVKSFLWRTGMMAVAAFLVIITDNIGMLEMSPFTITIVGLVLGEASKYVAVMSKTI